MPRPARFWHSLHLARPWLLTLAADADSGEDELFEDDEVKPHLVTASKGWRKLEAAELERWTARLAATKPSGVRLGCPPIPAEISPEYAAMAAEWHTLLSQSFWALKKSGKGDVYAVCEDRGWKVDGQKCGMESWEIVAVPDGAFDRAREGAKREGPQS